MIRTIIGAAALTALAACGGSSDTGEDTPNLPAPPPVSETPATDTTSSELADFILPLPDATSADITSEDIAVRVKTLADDAFEGRGPGTDAGEASARWIAAEMQRIGLKPGANGSYLQVVEMIEQTLDESKSRLTFTTVGAPDATSETTLPAVMGTDYVMWTKRQTADAMVFDPTDMVFVGYGVVAPEYGWNDYEGLDATGKTVVMLVNDPGYANPEGALFKGKSMTYYGRWTYKFEEAARQGATAAIVIHETAPASYGWDVVSSSWSGAQADLVRKNGGADRTMLEGWVSTDMATALFDANGLDFEEMKTAAATPGFSPVAMPATWASGEIHQSVETRQSHNVAGVIEGSERPDEYMLYTAHWDHIGVKPGGGDTIYNGAVDNATGTAAILEIAEKMMGDNPSRSVMFLAVTLEESGLLGSAYYAENPLVPLNKTVAGVNIDAMMPGGPSKDMIVVGYGASELEELLENTLSASGRTIKPDPKPEAGYFYRSDHISLAKKGVPMLYADGGLNKVEGGVAAGIEISEDYTRHRYHQPSDEYSDDWDLSGMVEDVTALYLVGLGVANDNGWIEWYDGNEFKAIRDASFAAE